jgi:transposase-like protein
MVISLCAKGLTTGEISAHLAEVYGTDVSRDDRDRDILGLWIGEGAKFWLQVLTKIRNRGTTDVCIAVCDGLKGLPDVISATGRWRSSRRVCCA